MQMRDCIKNPACDIEELLIKNRTEFIMMGVEARRWFGYYNPPSFAHQQTNDSKIYIGYLRTYIENVHKNVNYKSVEEFWSLNSDYSSYIKLNQWRTSCVNYSKICHWISKFLVYSYAYKSAVFTTNIWLTFESRNYFPFIHNMRR